MRISLVILFCLCIIVVNSATVKTTSRRVVTTAGRATTKAPVRKSAYDHLRSVAGKISCASGSCPFWERQGRSFVSLRCYAEQYKECVCLHRMCFSSCLFERKDCNDEMVSCLKQICPRCMPASQTAMCSAYDSVAVKIADALGTFTCYSCCPVRSNATTKPIITTTRPSNIGQPVPQNNGGLVPQNNGNIPANGFNNVNGGGAIFPGNGNVNINANTNGNSAPSQNQQAKQTIRPTTRPVVTTRRTSATTRRVSTVKAQKKPQANK